MYNTKTKRVLEQANSLWEKHSGFETFCLQEDIFEEKLGLTEDSTVENFPLHRKGFVQYHQRNVLILVTGLHKILTFLENGYEYIGENPASKKLLDTNTGVLEIISMLDRPNFTPFLSNYQSKFEDINSEKISAFYGNLTPIPLSNNPNHLDSVLISEFYEKLTPIPLSNDPTVYPNWFFEFLLNCDLNFYVGFNIHAEISGVEAFSFFL